MSPFCLLFPKLGTKPRNKPRWAVKERLAFRDGRLLNGLQLEWNTKWKQYGIKNKHIFSAWNKHIPPAGPETKRHCLAI